MRLVQNLRYARMGAMSGDYEYRGLIAASWDLLRGDYSTWPDRPFYRSIIECAGQPALDVGCGTGRLLLDYLAAGIDVDGVDNSPEMLVLCRKGGAAAGLDRFAPPPGDRALTHGLRRRRRRAPAVYATTVG